MYTLLLLDRDGRSKIDSGSSARRLDRLNDLDARPAFSARPCSSSELLYAGFDTGVGLLAHEACQF